MNLKSKIWWDTFFVRHFPPVGARLAKDAYCSFNAKSNLKQQIRWYIAQGGHKTHCDAEFADWKVLK